MKSQIITSSEFVREDCARRRRGTVSKRLVKMQHSAHHIGVFGLEASIFVGSVVGASPIMKESMPLQYFLI
jgi:hypothetical protein